MAIGKLLLVGCVVMPGLAGRAYGADADRSWLREPALIINVDNSHYFGSFEADRMTREGLHAYVDQYAGTKVTHIFWCPNAMRASFASKTRDPIWEVGGRNIPEKSIFANRWPRNAKLLHERGLDPYAVWIARCREQHISPWLSMRMNDVHDVGDPKNFMHSTFWAQHPEYWRVPGGKGSWVARALNYGIPEVREHAMSFIRELLERYDPDGLELDWMRFGYHFKPGEEAKGCKLLTEFTRQVRALTNDWSKRRGHPIKLAARVPAVPEAAIGLGMDGVTWAKEGLIDLLIPTPFWTTSDFDIPIEQWRERIGKRGKGVAILPGLEHNMRPYPGARQVSRHDLASMRGFAAAGYHRGGNGVYLFNFFSPGSVVGGQEAYRTLLEQGLTPKVAFSKPRRHVVLFHDTVPSGVSRGAQLPAKAESATFRIYTGPVPQGGSVVFITGLAPGEDIGKVRYAAKLNGTSCEPMADHPEPKRFPGVARAVRLACPISAMKEGSNTVQLSRSASPKATIVWAEIRIEPKG